MFVCVQVCLCARCEFTWLVSSVVNIIVYNSIPYKLKTEHNTIMSLKTPFDVMSWKHRRKWKASSCWESKQDTCLEPPVSWPLRYDDQTTTNPHNPLHVLYSWCWMLQSHTWQPLPKFNHLLQNFQRHNNKKIYCIVFILMTLITYMWEAVWKSWQ